MSDYDLVKLILKQVTSGEARRLLPPGSRLKFYDQSFTGEEYKLVSSEGVFHQVFPQSCLSQLIPYFAIWILKAIVCWSGLRPAHLLKLMSQLGEDYRCQ